MQPLGGHHLPAQSLFFVPLALRSPGCIKEHEAISHFSQGHPAGLDYYMCTGVFLNKKTSTLVCYLSSSYSSSNFVESAMRKEEKKFLPVGFFFLKKLVQRLQGQNTW